MKEVKVQLSMLKRWYRLLDTVIPQESPSSFYMEEWIYLEGMAVRAEIENIIKEKE